MSEERVCLDFLLKELRRWHTEGRVPETFLAPLYDEYTARRKALAPPRLEMYDLEPDSASHPPSAPPRPAHPSHSPRRGLLAFLEERNIAALHLVGSLLLLAGLFLLVQWQWDGIGRFLLLAVLALSAAGLLRLSDSLRDEHPQSSQVLGLLGCLIVPLCGIALKVFGLVGGLSWPLTALLTALCSGGVFVWRLRTTQEPLLIGLLGGAGAGAVWGFAGLVPATLFWPTLIISFLGLATLSFWQTERDDSLWNRMRVVVGHCLTLAGIGASLLWAAQVSGTATQSAVGLTLLGAAGLYGLTGSRLQIAWLGYAATFAAALGAQFLLPDTASMIARGAIASATGVLAQLMTRLQRGEGQATATPYQNSARALTLLGLFPVLLAPETRDVPLAGLFAAEALLWLVAARTAQGLLCTSALALAACRLSAIALDGWFVAATGLPAGPLRWLLLPSLAFGLLSLRTTTEERAVIFRQCALAAFGWACVGQFTGLLESKSAATNCMVLMLASTGLGLWGLWQDRPVAARGALIPLGFALAAQWVRWATVGHDLPLPVLALALFVAGVTLPAKADLGPRATLWLLAGGHLAASLLPTALLPFWSLALVPVLLWLGRAEGDTDRPLRLTEFFAVLGFLATVLLPSGSSPLSLVVTGAALASVSLLGYRPSGVATAAGLATAAVALAASGYPHPSLSLAQVSFLLAGLAAFWLGLAASLRRTTNLWETLSAVGVATTAVAVVTGVYGLTGQDQGQWTIYTLGLSAATLAAMAGLRRQPNYLHSAFACAFAAYGLYFFDQFGLGSDKLDYFLMPIGIYLLLIAERMNQAPLRAPGLLLLLGSSLLAIVTNPHDWQHAVLLVLECLVAVAAGIQQRVKVYLGGGIAFLITLLVIKLWDPLREINFGVYLTLLGVGVLTAALQFDKRREALRRWADSVRETYQSWD